MITKSTPTCEIRFDRHSSNDPDRREKAVPPEAEIGISWHMLPFHIYIINRMPLYRIS